MKFWYERISEYIRIEKNNTNECPNIFVSKKGYEYDTNEYSWREIFEYIQISEYSSHNVVAHLFTHVLSSGIIELLGNAGTFGPFKENPNL